MAPVSVELARQNKEFIIIIIIITSPMYIVQFQGVPEPHSICCQYTVGMVKNTSASFSDTAYNYGQEAGYLN
jgi:hypothetical protein